MKKEEKYNFLLLVLALSVILSLGVFKNTILSIISVILSIIVVLSKKWMIKTFF